MNDFLITKTFITETVLNSIENSMWKSLKVSIYDTLSITTSYAVRFNTQKAITFAAADAVNSLRGSAWAAATNATRDYFGQK